MGGFVYFFRDVYGNAGFMGAVQGATMISMMLGLLVVPKLIPKFGIRRVTTIGVGCAILAAVLRLFLYQSAAGLLLTSVLAGLSTAPVTCTMNAMVANMGEYLTWKSNVNVRGSAYSCVSVGMKLGAGLGAGIVGWLLAWGNYTPNVNVQPDSAITAIKIMFLVVPIIVAIIQFFSVALNDLENKMPQVQKDLAKQQEL